MRLARTTTTFRAGIAIAMALAFSALFMALAAQANAQTTDEGAEIYSQSCARCHGDDGLGAEGEFPPLAGNPDAGDHDYVVDVVTNGLDGKVILGVTYDDKMPPFGDRLSADEIQQVSAFVVELSVGGVPTPPTTVPSIRVGTAAIGEDLFRGTVLLSNGGVGCVACHSAGTYDGLGGPTLAFNLNGIVDVYGKDGFVQAITDPIVDPMVAVFEEHPITEQEATDLAAYLDTTGADAEGGSRIDILATLGFVGFLGLILITAMIVRGPQSAYVKKLRSDR